MRKNRLFLWALFVFVTVFVVYIPAVDNGFLDFWDDPKYVTENQDITGLTLRNIKAAFTSKYVSNYAPLHIISYAIDYTFFGLNPAAFHAVNIILHSVSSVLVMFLIFRISGNLILSVSSALIFAIHPVQVESVAWISERKNILSAVFALGSFLVYIDFLKNRRWLAFGGSLLLFAAGLLTKSSIVILPVLLCLYSLLFYKRCFANLVFTIPFFMLSVASSVATILAQEKAIIPYHGGSPYATALTMVTVLVKYLKLFLFPVNLAPIYNPVIYRNISFSVIACLAILFMLTTVLWMRRKDSELLLWAGWAFIPLLPVLQIIPFVSLMNDRYLYLSLVGLAPLTVKIISRVARNRAWIVIAVILLLMLPQTYARIELWKKGPDLWLDAIERYPDNVELYVRLSAGYRVLGQLDNAGEIYQKILAMTPDDVITRQLYGTLLLMKGRHKAALAELKAVYDAGVRNDDLLSNLGYAYMDIGDIKAGIKYHEEVLATNPEHTNSIYGMALGYEKLGDRAQARVYWQKFINIAEPSNPWRQQAIDRLEQKQ